MNSESCSSPPGKRSRDMEDEAYVDNLHSHKRYLSEIMASSLNGLTVGDAIPDNIGDSPIRSENTWFSREDMSCQCSPMSDDSEDSRCSDISCHIDNASGQSSPASPHRYQKPIAGFFSACPSASYSSMSCHANVVACSQPRQRGSDSEARFPSSPSDICHPSDLRRAALLRSVQMRVNPPSLSLFELPYCNMQDQELVKEDGTHSKNVVEVEYSLAFSDCLQNCGMNNARDQKALDINGLENPHHFLDKESALGPDGN